MLLQPVIFPIQIINTSTNTVTEYFYIVVFTRADFHTNIFYFEEFNSEKSLL